MKKLALTVLSTLGVLSTAHAQSSSVQIYGILDYGIQYGSNDAGHRLIGGTSGVKQGSRWGLRGSEDLGDGNAAIFRVENGFNVGTGGFGQSGLEFGRQAWVGLASKHYGTVTMGRQYDSVVDNVAALDQAMKTGGGNTTHVGDLDNLNNVKRVNNSVKYTTPSINGLTANMLYGFGGQAGDVTRNQIWSIGAHYDHGPFQAGAAYMNARDPNQSFFTNLPTNTTGTSLNNMSAYPAFSGYASAHTYQNIAAIANYTFDKLTVGVNYSNVQFKNIGDTSVGANPLRLSGTATFHTGELNVSYLFRPDINVGFVYSLTHSGGVGTVGSSNYHTFSLAYDYLLSKRTDVYVLASYQIANGTDSTGKSARADLAVLDPSSSNRQTFLMAGIRHTF